MTTPLDIQNPQSRQERLRFRAEQLERRPEMAAGVALVHLYSWNYDTSNAFPTATWRAVANITNDSYFEEAVRIGEFGYDFDTGGVSTTITAEYLICGWAQFWEDPEEGETRIVAIHFGSSDRIIEMYPFKAAHGSIAGLKLPVTGHRLGALSACALEVWHDHSTDLSLRDASFSVYRIRSFSPSDVELRP